MSLSSSFHSEELHSWALCSSACHASPISLSLKSENESWRVASDSSQPHGLEPARLLCPWNFQARLLEWAAIPSSRGWELNSQLPFSTQGSNLGLSHCRQILDHLSHQGSPLWLPHNFPHNFQLRGPSITSELALLLPCSPAKKTELSIWLQFTSNHCLNCAQLLDQINLFHIYSLLDGYFSVTVKTYFKKSVINFSS